MNDYTKQADDFLTAHNLEFRAVLVGDDCPRFCEDAEKMRDMDKVNTFPRRSHIHGKHYRCTISGTDRGHVSFDFWNSYADEEQNAIVGKFMPWHIPQLSAADAALACKYKGKKRTTIRAYDLLACIEKSDPGDFEEFCSNFGYDTDSRRAEDTWRAVVKEWQKVKKFFTAEELEQLQEVQ